jgi:hypothetical protein
MMCNRLYIFISITLALVLALIEGCTTSQIKVTQGIDTAIPPGDGIVIFHSHIEALRVKREWFAKCVEKTILKNRPDQLFVDDRTFKDALFPWFETNTAPKTPADLPKLLARPLVKDKISELGVRYVIFIAGDTTGSPADAHGLSDITFAGWWGLHWWDRETSLAAIVWDLKKAEEVCKVEATASGTTIMPAIIIPIPIMPMTETTTCEELGRQLVELLTP